MDKIEYAQKYSSLRYPYLAAILIVTLYIVFDLQSFYIVRNNFGEAYAHIFNNTKNAVTKNIDGKYQVSFLPYPSTPLVNDTSNQTEF